MNGNTFISWVLRSPFHGLLSNGMMLITVTGRKTGKKYTTPVGYYQQDGCLWILTSRDRQWWRNVTNGTEVSVLLKKKPVQGFAEAELDAQAVEAHMFEYIKHVPMAAKPLGIRMENNTANAEDIARGARDRLFVKIKV